MRTIIPLRVASIASSAFFIAYASVTGVWPMLATELVLLPLNAVRLAQDMRRGTGTQEVAGIPVRVVAQGSHADYRWSARVNEGTTYSLAGL